MRFPLRLRLEALLLLIALAFVTAACGGTKRPPVLAGGPADATSSDTARSGADQLPAQPVDEGPDVRAVEGETAYGSDIAAASAAGTEGGPLDDVRFEYDSAQLSDTARATLEKHAAWLQSRREVRVMIEGHCDERGTVEYNLALGELRARTVRDYLASLGVADDRLRVASYGKERPLDPAATEEAYAKNRRAHFVVGR